MKPYWILPDLPKGCNWSLRLDGSTLVINIFRGPNWLWIFRPWLVSGQVEIQEHWRQETFDNAVMAECKRMIDRLDRDIHVKEWVRTLK